MISRVEGAVRGAGGKGAGTELGTVGSGAQVKRWERGGRKERRDTKRGESGRAESMGTSRSRSRIRTHGWFNQRHHRTVTMPPRRGHGVDRMVGRSARAGPPPSRKAQSTPRPTVPGRYGHAPLMIPAGGPTLPNASTMRTASTPAAPDAARRSPRVVARPGPPRAPGGCRSAPRRWSSVGRSRWDPPAPAGPDGGCASRGPCPVRDGEAKGFPAERIGMRLDVRPGELPAPPAHATLGHPTPAGPGAPVALAGRHSCVQLSDISAPSRYRSR